MPKSFKILVGISGALFIILGILFLANPVGALVSMAWLLGFFTLVSGISQLVFVLNAQRIIPNSGTRVLGAILQIIIGCILLSNKVFVGASLPIIFAVWVMAEGIIGAIKSFDYKEVGYKFWWGILLLGICGAVLGFIGLLKPLAAGKALGIIIGFAVIAEGISYFVMLGGLNRFEKRVRKGVDKFLNAADEQ